MARTRDGHDLTVPSISNRVEEHATWVSIADGARYAGVSRAAVEGELQSGNVRTKREGRATLVALESLLAATTPHDIAKLRARIERALSLEGVPDAVREWAESMRDVVFPVLDRLADAEARAALAEARLHAARGAED